MTLKLGKTIRLVPFLNIDGYGRNAKGAVPGEIVFINWRHKFFTVLFKFPGGCRYRESFKFIIDEDGEPCLIQEQSE